MDGQPGEDAVGVVPVGAWQPHHPLMSLPDLIEAHRTYIDFGQGPPHLSTAARSYCQCWNWTGRPEIVAVHDREVQLLLLLDVLLSGACSTISLSG